MLIRLILLIVFSFCISYWLWPLNNLYIYGIVLGVGAFVFSFPFSKLLNNPLAKTPTTSKTSDNVVQLEAFRRKKNKAEKRQKQTGHKKY